MSKFIIPSRGNSGKGSMAEQPRGSTCSKDAAAKSLENREKMSKIYRMFTVSQKSVEVVDREISWGWPFPTGAKGKLWVSLEPFSPFFPHGVLCLLFY